MKSTTYASRIRNPRLGRHAIQRGRMSSEARRLRHAHMLLPTGLHRTRVSEMRGYRVCAPGAIAGRHPSPIVERTRAVRLPISPG